MCLRQQLAHSETEPFEGAHIRQAAEERDEESLLAHSHLTAAHPSQPEFEVHAELALEAQLQAKIASFESVPVTATPAAAAAAAVGTVLSTLADASSPLWRLLRSHHDYQAQLRVAISYAEDQANYYSDTQSMRQAQQPSVAVSKHRNRAETKSEGSSGPLRPEPKSRSNFVKAEPHHPVDRDGDSSMKDEGVKAEPDTAVMTTSSIGPSAAPASASAAASTHQSSSRSPTDWVTRLNMTAQLLDRARSCSNVRHRERLFAVCERLLPDESLMQMPQSVNVSSTIPLFAAPFACALGALHAARAAATAAAAAASVGAASAGDPSRHASLASTHRASAIRCYSRALEIEPTSAVAMNQLLVLLLTQTPGADADEQRQHVHELQFAVRVATRWLARARADVGVETAASEEGDNHKVNVDVPFFDPLSSAVAVQLRAALTPAAVEAHVSVLSNIGLCLQLLGDSATAIVALREALSLCVSVDGFADEPGAKSRATLWMNYGCLLRSVNSPSAVAALRCATLLAPHSAETHVNLSLALLQQNQLSEAWSAMTLAHQVRGEGRHRSVRAMSGGGLSSTRMSQSFCDYCDVLSALLS